MGIFELVNHPIAPALCDEMLLAMQHFFALPLADKRACERTEHNHWGFYDRELTKNVQDWKQLYDVGPEHGTCVPQWPEKQDGFRHTTEAFYSACESTALGLVGAIARALGEAPDGLLSSFRDHSSYLRMNYYPLCHNPAPARYANWCAVGAFGDQSSLGCGCGDDSASRWSVRPAGGTAGAVVRCLRAAWQYSGQYRRCGAGLVQ